MKLDGAISQFYMEWAWFLQFFVPISRKPATCSDFGWLFSLCKFFLFEISYQIDFFLILLMCWIYFHISFLFWWKKSYTQGKWKSIRIFALNYGLKKMTITMHHVVLRTVKNDDKVNHHKIHNENNANEDWIFSFFFPSGTNLADSLPKWLLVH